MVYSQHLKKDISVVRVVLQFYPRKGGSITHVIELSKKIHPYLKNQIIIAPDFGDECREFDENFEVPIIRVKYHSIKKRFGIPLVPNLLYMINVYIQLKKMERPNLIHTHGISATAFGTIISKLLNMPIVGMLHGSSKAYSKISDSYETILAKLFKPDYALVLDDGSMAPEKFKKNWGDRVTIVDHGIDVNIFKPMEKKGDLLKKLGLKESDFIILSTSSLIPVKNVDLAIKSFEIFLKKTKKNNAYLLIVGEGVLKDHLVELVKGNYIENNVTFLGEIPIDMIPEYLSISDAVVGTSLYSNMNRSVQEAMACEKPVVAFDSGGTGKLIKHMKNGLLAKSGDRDDFAEKLRLLYEKPELREKLGKNARETIITERGWETRIKKELEVYEKVLHEKNEK